MWLSLGNTFFRLDVCTSVSGSVVDSQPDKITVGVTGTVGLDPRLNIVTEVAIHPELPRCRSASGAHVLEYAARRFSLRLAFRAAPNFIDHVFNFHFDPPTR
jgi:hypothetical protein